MTPTESKKHYIAAYEHRQAQRESRAPDWLCRLRDAGIAYFATVGFPTVKSEDWKYTSVEPIATQKFGLANGEAKSLSASDFLTRSQIDPVAPRLVFVNGIYRSELSNLGALPRGMTVTRLRECIEHDESTVAAHLGRYAVGSSEPFVGLNSAFFSDGALISLADGCRSDREIYLVYVSSAAERPIVSHPRTLIWLGAGSEAKVVESYMGLAGNYFCNAVTELVGGPDAVIEHFRLQQEGDVGFHVGALAARLDRNCQLTAHGVSLSGALVRNHVHVELDGEGAGCVLNGLYLADGKQHVDNFTEIEHVKPRATSLELYKGILSGSAHGVFNGKIVVHKDAQKSDARQTNKNLLLSDNAVVNTKPQLEIYADDVKCSHGSTIGQLDRDALFYLRSRGLSLAEARSLLSFAFASDVVGRVKIDALHKRLNGYLASRFGGRWMDQ